MDPNLVEEIRMWFEETNGSASLMSEWFSVPLLEAKELIRAWENDDSEHPEYWS